MRGRKTAVVGAATAVLTAGAVVSGQVGVAAAAAHAPATAQASDGGELARFESQKITWHSCQTGPTDEVGKALDAAKGQCAEITVPLDYRRPDGRTITLTMSRTNASDPARRRGVLMLNPGGPGLSAIQLHTGLATAGLSWSAGYDLIGMDPRGVGRSSPVNCGWPTVTALRSAGPDRRAFGESVTFAKSLAAACARNDRELLSNLSTRNAARDMDVIRAALGEEKISYFGFSYGTYLGAVYTQLFPRRVDRFVLDSAADPDAAGPDALRRNGPAGAAALRNWAGWAARRDSTYHLGVNPDQVLATVDQVNRAVARRPLYEVQDGVVKGEYSVYNMSIGGMAGVLISTMEDVNRFYRALLTGGLISSEQLEQMKTTVPITKPGYKQIFQGYGLGIARTDLFCGSFWGHGGDGFGTRTRPLSSSDGRRQVAVGFNMQGWESVDKDGNLASHPIGTATTAHQEQALCGSAKQASATE